MTSPVPPSSTRNFQNIPPINRAANDSITDDGTRISLCLYIDPTMNVRKNILNAVRELCNQPVEPAHQPTTMSGISVIHNATLQPKVESYLGMSIDNLRSNVLFQRGGLEISLVLKLLAVTGLSLVTDKEIASAIKAKQALVKQFVAAYPFNV